MLLGDVGYRMCEWCLGGSEGMSETGRSLLSSKAVKFEFFDAQCARMCEDFFGGMWVRGGKTMDLRSSQKPQVSIKSQS